MNKTFGVWLACVLFVVGGFLAIGYYVISPSLPDLVESIGNLIPARSQESNTTPDGHPTSRDSNTSDSQVYISFGSDEGLSDDQWRAYATCRNGGVEYKCTAEWTMFPTSAASIDRKTGVITIHSVDQFEICAHVDGKMYSRCGAAVLPKVNRSQKKPKPSQPIG